MAGYPITDYVVLETTGQPRRHAIPPKTWLKIKKHLIACGRDVVAVGDCPPWYDLAGCALHTRTFDTATTINIIGRAECLIAMDGDLVRLAARTDCPMVIGCAPTSPPCQLPIRHGQAGWRCVAVSPKSDCRHCERAPVTNEVICPLGKNFECVQSIPAGDYIVAYESFF